MSATLSKCSDWALTIVLTRMRDKKRRSPDNPYKQDFLDLTATKYGICNYGNISEIWANWRLGMDLDKILFFTSSLSGRLRQTATRFKPTDGRSLRKKLANLSVKLDNSRFAYGQTAIVCCCYLHLDFKRPSVESTPPIKSIQNKNNQNSNTAHDTRWNKLNLFHLTPLILKLFLRFHGQRISLCLMTPPCKNWFILI